MRILAALFRHRQGRRERHAVHTLAPRTAGADCRPPVCSVPVQAGGRFTSPETDSAENRAPHHRLLTMTRAIAYTVGFVPVASLFTLAYWLLCVQPYLR